MSEGRCYSSSLVYCLPFSLLSFPFLVGAVVLVFMGVSSQQMHGAYVHRACLLGGGLFCLACVRALLTAAFRDYYSEICLDQQGILFRKPMSSWRLEWNQIKLLSQTDSTLTITTTLASEIEISTTVRGFAQLCGQIRQEFEERKRQ